MAILVVTYDSSNGKYLTQKVGSAQISDGAIVSGKIGAGEVCGIHIASGAIVRPHIYDQAVASTQIAIAAIGGIHIYSGSIPGDKLENRAITSAKIASGQVGIPHIYPSAITSAKIGANVIATPHILNQGILSASIGALAVGTPHLAANAIVSGKVSSGGLSPLNSGKIWAGWGGFPREENKPAAAAYGHLTVAAFQFSPAEGTFNSNPQYINDTLLVNAANAHVIGEYAQVTLIAPSKITQWRQYGDTGNVAPYGVWKIEYLGVDEAWHDWVTGIACLDSNSWSGWDSSGGEVVAIAIRLTCTTVDGSQYSRLRELEVKY